MRPPMIALVGVEPHFAVSERTKRLAVGVDVIADDHHVVPLQRIGRALRTRLRRYPLRDRAEMGSESALLLFAKVRSWNRSTVCSCQASLICRNVSSRSGRLRSTPGISTPITGCNFVTEIARVCSASCDMFPSPADRYRLFNATSVAWSCKGSPLHETHRQMETVAFSPDDQKVVSGGRRHSRSGSALRAAASCSPASLD